MPPGVMGIKALRNLSWALMAASACRSVSMTASKPGGGERNIGRMAA